MAIDKVPLEPSARVYIQAQILSLNVAKRLAQVALKLFTQNVCRSNISEKSIINS